MPDARRRSPSTWKRTRHMPQGDGAECNAAGGIVWQIRVRLFLSMNKKIQKQETLTALAAEENGEIFELEGYAALGMSQGQYQILTSDNTVAMPHGSELMLLPGRIPVVYDLVRKEPVLLSRSPYDPRQRIYPVAVFNSPGYVNRYCCAYDTQNASHVPLPLFSYGAVGFGQNGFFSSAIQVDKEPRQDLRCMPEKKIIKGVKSMRRDFPKNRLMRHLETCALEYGCPAGKNFFLGRYEAPLPSSRVCNARCMGCISLQEESHLCACQDRIAFAPKAEEITQVALTHIGRVDQAVVSFGQGCEGEPLTSANTLGTAIGMIRKQTSSGTINLNTNASLPRAVENLCRAGLDSMRVSMNSVRKDNYLAYFRPASYKFEHVLESIDRAKDQGKFVSMNYLNCPGVTDSQNEAQALFSFIETHGINMIQWRNLNYDPLCYWQFMEKIRPGGKALGMHKLIAQLKEKFPSLIHGYFNPPKERFTGQ